MKPATLVLFLAAACWATASAQTGPLEVHMALTKTTILLGEPVWIEVTATNRSSQSLSLDWGVACAYFSKPIQIEIPDAMQGDGQPKPCGMGGSCPQGYTPSLLPGQTETSRYIVFGNFRITQPGHYEIIAHKPFAYAPAPVKESIGLPKDHSSQTFDFQGSLDVLPPDPAKLLAIEQVLAAEASAAPTPKLLFDTPPHPSSDASLKTQRAWSDANVQASQDVMLRRYSIYEALADYPVAGMEPVFAAWATPPSAITYYGITALKRLNTTAARAAFAHLAQLPEPGQTNEKVPVSVARATAIDALSALGDRSYLPLLEQLTADPDQGVRFAAITGTGKLGGADTLPFLDRLARNGRTSDDRSTAIQAMCSTGSAKAVPLLLALFDDPPPASDPTAPSYALTWLTHHQLPAALQRETPDEMQSAWRAWWTQNASTAHIFGEYDCGPFNR